MHAGSLPPGLTDSDATLPHLPPSNCGAPGLEGMSLGEILEEFNRQQEGKQGSCAPHGLRGSAVRGGGEWCGPSPNKPPAGGFMMSEVQQQRQQQWARHRRRPPLGSTLLQGGGGGRDQGGALMAAVLSGRPSSAMAGSSSGGSGEKLQVRGRMGRPSHSATHQCSSYGGAGGLPGFGYTRRPSRLSLGSRPSRPSYQRQAGPLAVMTCPEDPRGVTEAGVGVGGVHGASGVGAAAGRAGVEEEEEEG